MADEQERVRSSGVWAAAVGVARIRALETERGDALFRGPLEQAFAAAGGLWSSSLPPEDEGARRSRLAVWIAEGLSICLPEDAVELLPARIGERSAAGSRMGLTWGSRGVIERFGADAVPGSAVSLRVLEVPGDPVGRLAGHGWEAGSHTLRERAAAYGRPIGTLPRREERPGGLISAVRRWSASRFAG